MRIPPCQPSLCFKDGHRRKGAGSLPVDWKLLVTSQPKGHQYLYEREYEDMKKGDEGRGTRLA